jgi:hypothetical protein
MVGETITKAAERVMRIRAVRAMRTTLRKKQAIDDAR